MPDRPGGLAYAYRSARKRPAGRLPRAEFDVLRSYMTLEALPQGKVLAEVGDEIDKIYFPFGGMISLLLIMKDGRAIETSTIGKNGVFGAPATFGLYKSRVRAIIQVQMTAAVIPASTMRRHGETSKALQIMCLKYNETLLAQARTPPPATRSIGSKSASADGCFRQAL